MLTSLSQLKKAALEREEKKPKFKIKGVRKKIVITNRMIEDKVQDLYQYCNSCETNQPFYRITYNSGKRACQCLQCGTYRRIATTT